MMKHADWFIWLVLGLVLLYHLWCKIQSSVFVGMASNARYDVTEMPAGQEMEDEVDNASMKDLSASAPQNIYVGKRNFIHQLMDVALLMANVSQLKALLSLSTSDKYFYMLMTFICMSITLQVVFTICMLAIWSLEKTLKEHITESPPVEDPEDANRKLLAGRLDKVGNIVVLLIIVSNVFITGFGVESRDNEGHNSSDSQP